MISFWRNAFVSFSALFIMIIMLFVIGSTIFSQAVFSYTKQILQDKVDVNVYFVTTATESDILSIEKSLEALPEVSQVTYISRQQALDNFKARHEGDQVTLQALDELSDNPLGASLNIKAKDSSQYEGIASFLKSKEGLSKDGELIIDKVNYYQNKVTIDRLNRLISFSDRASAVATILFVFLSIVITFNTIRLAIYVYRDEISVMRLVGASGKYVRGPFVVTGILYGLFASLLTLILFFPLLYWLAGITAPFLSGLNIFDYYILHFLYVAIVLIASGVAVGALSSYLAVRRYLEV
ncbi:MAG: permease-like cell division protein FtsX [Candidatus Paceibacterota bacterium]|jgi:cell division transport system permease protein